MIFPEGAPAPNFVARNISLRFPVRLNLDARVREHVGGQLRDSERNLTNYL
jgi:hypothetical protein